MVSMELLCTLLRGRQVPTTVNGNSLVIGGQVGTRNVSTTPLFRARQYADEVFAKAGKSLKEEYPKFDQNYIQLQKAAKQALGVARGDMPVITQHDIKDFQRDLKQGNIDLFKPFTLGKATFPKDLLTKREDAKNWLTLGQQDGDPNDDVVKTTLGNTPVRSLKPIQNQIWLEKSIPYMVSSEWKGSFWAIVVSKDHYIIDGHHRWAQMYMADPSSKLRTLFVPLPIGVLLKLGRSYGNAKGQGQRK